MLHRFETPHPAFAGFSEFYAREILPDLAELERRRRAGAKKARITIAATALPGLVLVATGLFLGKSGGPFGLVGIALVAGGVWLGRKYFSRAARGSKSVLMERICGFVGFGYQVDCEPAAILPFSQLALVPDYDFAKLEDRISGAHSGVEFELFEADLTTMSRNKGSEREWGFNQGRVFRGLLMRFTFDKPFSGTTLVTQDRGWAGNAIEAQHFHIKRVKLEDPTFESHFEVYGSDQVESRYLLTPLFMERVLALSERVGQDRLRLAFHDNALAISLQTDRNFFEAGSIVTGSMVTGLDAPRQVQDMLLDISTPLHIIEALKLDRPTRA